MLYRTTKKIAGKDIFQELLLGIAIKGILMENIAVPGQGFLGAYSIAPSSKSLMTFSNLINISVNYRKSDKTLIIWKQNDKNV